MLYVQSHGWGENKKIKLYLKNWVNKTSTYLIG